MSKKFFLIVLTMILCLAVSLPGYCSLQNWHQLDKNAQLNKVFPGYLQAAGTVFGDATSMTTSDTAVPVTYAVVYKAIAAAAATDALAGTLANGTPGQLLKIFITETVDSGVFTLTPTTKRGFASLGFNAANDEATLLYVNDTTGWILISSTSVTVTFPTAELDAL